eukprot:TRINITY_DN2378_c0_g1_i15.p1 TRINITY_DN2378_c0_g1~~TRINITY_DN2378_c0_g1_i15.p1  ORF type:complete len:210 (-),score=-21.70 TRINITY_DN2378_c0_g1_i15:265-894(-)
MNIFNSCFHLVNISVVAGVEFLLLFAYRTRFSIIYVSAFVDFSNFSMNMILQLNQEFLGQLPRWVLNRVSGDAITYKNKFQCLDFKDFQYKYIKLNFYSLLISIHNYNDSKLTCQLVQNQVLPQIQQFFQNFCYLLMQLFILCIILSQEKIIMQRVFSKVQMRSILLAINQTYQNFTIIIINAHFLNFDVTYILVMLVIFLLQSHCPRL